MKDIARHITVFSICTLIFEHSTYPEISAVSCSLSNKQSCKKLGKPSLKQSKL